MEVIKDILMAATIYFYELTKSYGWAIILLTVVVKLVLYPLSVKQFQSIRSMKKIQPKIKELQKKYKDKPEQMQKELLKVYQENKVNPLGGCLPLLIQLPIIYALFATLRSEAFINLPGEKSFLWIADLSKPDLSLSLWGMPLPIMALIVGITTYFSQKLMVTDQEQQKIMAFMPFMLFFFSINLNSGVLIYWAVSNLLTSLQQLYLENKVSEGETKVKISGGKNVRRKN